MATPMPPCRRLFGRSRYAARRQQPALLLHYRLFFFIIVFLHAGSTAVSTIGGGAGGRGADSLRSWSRCSGLVATAHPLLPRADGCRVGLGRLVRVVGRGVVNVIERRHEIDSHPAELALENADVVPRVIRFVFRRRSPQVVPVMT